VKEQTPSIKFWKLYAEETIAPAAYLLRDATITLIALALLALILLASKGFAAIGAPDWFTTKLETVDLLFALIDVVILGVDTTGKLAWAALRRTKHVLAADRGART
jgi:hypothetical protein